jgi:hypothetical protein
LLGHKYLAGRLICWLAGKLALPGLAAGRRFAVGEPVCQAQRRACLLACLFTRHSFCRLVSLLAPSPCSLSPLAIQTRNLLEDPRCSVVVQMPGWTGLANARVTIFGEVYKLPTLDLQEQAQEVGGCVPSMWGGAGMV